MVNPRPPAEARSNTAHTNDKQECSLGRRPITLIAVKKVLTTDIRVPVVG
jgi:hypothetical protein